MKNKIIKEKDIAILLKGAVYLEDKDAAVLLPETCAICPEAIVGEGIVVKQSDIIPQLNQVPEYAIWCTDGNTENVNIWGWHETTYDSSIDWGRYNDATSLYIGEGLTEISLCPDNVCYIHLPESINYISTEAFYNNNLLRVIDMPSKVRTLGSSVFAGCNNLKSIRIPEGATELAYGPMGFFEECSSLKEVSLPETLLIVGDYAFYGCSSLTSITIPNSVTSIGDGAFYGCCYLTSIIIPESVTSIGVYAFYGCNAMRTIYIEATIPPILSSHDFDFVTEIYVPVEFVETYKTATNWSYYSDIIQAIP